MATLFNFKLKKYKYFNDKYFLFYHIMPKNKGYVITKILNIEGMQNVKKLLRHLKNSKNINFAKNKLITWLDYK